MKKNQKAGQHIDRLYDDRQRVHHPADLGECGGFNRNRRYERASSR